MADGEETRVTFSAEEPDWRRIPGWRSTTAAEWSDPSWQTANSITSPEMLGTVLGRSAAELVEALRRDQAGLATMSIRIPPHTLNVMCPDRPLATDALLADPVRRYMLPVDLDRHPRWPSHPMAARDPLHEAEMWAVEGLTHRYPGKVLAELTTKCPQYCGHCTRMDLVGNPTVSFAKVGFSRGLDARQANMLAYIQAAGIEDVVVSGGDVASVPWPKLESFLNQLIDIESVRDLRIASKSLVSLPQVWLQPELLAGLRAVAARACKTRTILAFHTHANAAQEITPIVQRAVEAVQAAGIAHVRNQCVLLNGVNASIDEQVRLNRTLYLEARIEPYYVYMCDMVPNSEHWRVTLDQAREIADGIMGHLPGYATPRVVCDVPGGGKKLVSQVESYDRTTGISTWRAAASRLPLAPDTRFRYYDPVHLLSPDGQGYWDGYLAGDTP